MLMRVALFGECMLELSGQPFGNMQQGFGGDTLNTAIYLARCAPAGHFQLSYATALGDDPLSDGLLERWAAAGIDNSLVRRLPGRLPGLYQIAVDARGERSFSYWRDNSAARSYFDAEQTPLEENAGHYDAFYFSGISLAILPPAGRERLFALLSRFRDAGAAVIFDNNYRPRLWSDPHDARANFERAFSLSSIALITADDHQALHGEATPENAARAAQRIKLDEAVIKRGAASTLVRERGSPGWVEVPTQKVDHVVDTTAAGDSFAAGYLSRRLLGARAADAAAFGSRLAARVIQHQGALIPREVMEDLTLATEKR
jgi:2-dehydro-3-deoxygluconokinase